MATIICTVPNKSNHGVQEILLAPAFIGANPPTGGTAPERPTTGWQHPRPKP